MLSRLALRTALQANKCIVPSLQAHKGAPSSLIGAIRSSSDGQIPFDSPERDLVNFPRPKQLEDVKPVRYIFVPESYFEFFYNKTGVTGPYVFAGGLTTYLLSKEIWVWEHDFGFVFTFAFLVYFINKKYGKKIFEFTNNLRLEEEKKVCQAGRDQVEGLKNNIEFEKQAQWRADGQMMIFDAKRENVALQLEAIYRERAFQVYNEVKKRLDFQLEIENVERRIAQKHMVQWIINHVLKSISGQQEQDTLKNCIVDLKALAARA